MCTVITSMLVSHKHCSPFASCVLPSSIIINSYCPFCSVVQFSPTICFRFPALSPGEESQNFYPPDIEEGNILYVAVTRAKKSLILTRTLATLLKDAGVRNCTCVDDYC